MAFLTEHRFAIGKALISKDVSVMQDPKYQYSVRINIDSESGEFSCTLPDFALNYIRIEANTLLGKKYLHMRRNKWCIVASTLDEIKHYLSQIAKYTVPQERSYPVIRYAINTSVSYCMDKAGNVYPNGANLGVNNYEWCDDELFTAGKDKSSGYNLGIYAGAFMRTDHFIVDDNGVEKIIDTQYKRFYDEENGGTSMNNKTIASKLNAWCSMKLQDGIKFNEIPYSDKAAEFFYNAIFNLVEQSIKIRQFFEDEKVIEALKTGNVSLLSGVRLLGQNE